MRLRTPSQVIVTIISLAAAAHCSTATAQIEFAKSTIRVIPGNESDQRPAPAPVRIFTAPVVKPLPVEEPRLEAEPLAPHAAPAAEHTAQAKRYPVRQADFVSPPAPRSLVETPAPAARAPSTVNVYSSAAAQSTLSKMPRPAPVHRQSATTAPPKPGRDKPFQNVQSEPVISPYMNLYRNDDSTSNLSNYFTMVRPQLEQQQANRRQAAELQRLHSQLQNLSGGPPNSGRMTAHAHYMDTAQFYQGTRH